MNCRTCNYALWNIAPGPCPECGNAFRPSEYRFMPGMVQFLCPHCRQQYFGTDRDGLLVPREFTCVKCAAPIELDQMILIPAAGRQEDQTSAGHVPWTDANTPLHRRWWQTVAASMTKPSALGKGIRPGESTLKPWSFTLVTCVLICLVASLVSAVALSAIMGLAVPTGTIPRGALGAAGLGIGVLIIVVGFVGYPLGILIWGALAHLILQMGEGKPAYSLRQTYAAICYASGASAINLIPCLGMYNVVGSIWWVVASVFTLRHAQRVSTLKAVLAAVLPPLLAASTCITAYVGFVGFALSKAATVASSRGATSAADFAQVQLLNSALVGYQKPGGTAWPGHVAELAFANSVPSTGFTLPSKGFLAVGLPLLETTLDQAMLLPATAEKQMRARVAAMQMPPVYRYGDCIFCYQGVPGVLAPAGPDPSGLWLFFTDVDPALVRMNTSPFGATAPSGGNGIVYIGMQDGTSTQISASAFAAALASQNTLRSSFGLPPIPAPQTLRNPVSPPPAGQSSDN